MSYVSRFEYNRYVPGSVRVQMEQSAQDERATRRDIAMQQEFLPFSAPWVEPKSCDEHTWGALGMSLVRSGYNILKGGTIGFGKNLIQGSTCDEQGHFSAWQTAKSIGLMAGFGALALIPGCQPLAAVIGLGLAGKGAVSAIGGTIDSAGKVASGYLEGNWTQAEESSYTLGEHLTETATCLTGAGAAARSLSAGRLKSLLGKETASKELISGAGDHFEAAAKTVGNSEPLSQMHTEFLEAYRAYKPLQAQADNLAGIAAQDSAAADRLTGWSQGRVDAPRNLFRWKKVGPQTDAAKARLKAEQSRFQATETSQKAIKQRLEALEKLKKIMEEEFENSKVSNTETVNAEMLDAIKHVEQTIKSDQNLLSAQRNANAFESRKSYNTRHRDVRKDHKIELKTTKKNLEKAEDAYKNASPETQEAAWENVQAAKKEVLAARKLYHGTKRSKLSSFFHNTMGTGRNILSPGNMRYGLGTSLDQFREATGLGNLSREGFRTAMEAPEGIHKKLWNYGKSIGEDFSLPDGAFENPIERTYAASKRGLKQYGWMDTSNPFFVRPFVNPAWNRAASQMAIIGASPLMDNKRSAEEGYNPYHNVPKHISYDQIQQINRAIYDAEGPNPFEYNGQL